MTHAKLAQLREACIQHAKSVKHDNPLKGHLLECAEAFTQHINLIEHFNRLEDVGRTL